jgi:hypothetical protein
VILTGARIITETGIIPNGAIAVDAGMITSVDAAPSSAAGAVDLWLPTSG